MNWRTEWRAISDRIGGFVEATTVFLRGLGVENSDGYATRRKHLLPAARDIYAAITRFGEVHRSALPPPGQISVERFVKDGKGPFTDVGLDNIEAVVATATALAGFRSELEYHLADLSAVQVRTTERAFQHLQRQIVADSDYRKKWQAVYKEGEPKCEGLGSVHLLQHGIWAFKVSSEGGRTDLVFAEPLGDLDAVARSAEALVLTEWKLVRSPAELPAKIAEARLQADLYSAGVLGGLELASYRYLVMVSESILLMPPDVTAEGIQYCHRNVAVNPSTPSKISRRAP